MANNNLTPFELEPVYIEFREESQVGYDITIHQNDTMTLNFICRNMGQLEDMTQYNVELRIHNGSSNTDYIQTQTDIIKTKDGTVKIKCSSKLAQYSGNCKGVLHIWKDDHSQKSTRLISIRVITDPTETIQGRIAESTITKLDELDWLLKEAYKLESEFEQKIEEAIKTKNELNNKIVEANSTRKTVEDTIVTANTSRSNLEKTDKTANDTNDILNKTIVNADNSKKVLDESKTNADNSKKVLDASTEVANNTNLAVNNSNKTALETKKEVDESIKNAIETKKNVDNSNAIALETKSILESTTINADNKKKEVDKSIENSITNKANLDKSNEEAKNTDGQLNITNITSTKTKEDLHNENVLADGKIEVMKKIDPNNVLTDVGSLKKEVIDARGVYPNLNDRITNIIGKDVANLYIGDTEPSLDGLWIDTTGSIGEVGGSDLLNDIKGYVNKDIKPLIGDGTKLNTTDKTNLVNAINENTTQLSECAKNIKKLDDIKINKKVKYYTGETNQTENTPNNILDGSFLIAHELNPVPNNFCYYEQFFYGEISEKSNRIQYVSSYNGEIRHFIRRYFDGVWEVKQISTTARTTVTATPGTGVTIQRQFNYIINNVLYIDTMVKKTDGTLFETSTFKLFTIPNKGINYEKVANMTHWSDLGILVNGSGTGTILNSGECYVINSTAGTKLLQIQAIIALE